MIGALLLAKLHWETVYHKNHKLWRYKAIENGYRNVVQQFTQLSIKGEEMRTTSPSPLSRSKNNTHKNNNNSVRAINP